MKKSSFKGNKRDLPLCRHCKKEIEVDATICTECNHYQDWRRYFSFSQVILSLLIALISVTTVAVPVIESYLFPGHSDVQFSLVSYDADKIIVWASNLGERPAFLKSVALFISGGGIRKDSTLTMKSEDLGKIIAPGESYKFELVPIVSKSATHLPSSIFSDTRFYELKFTIMELNNKQTLFRELHLDR